MVRRFLLLLLIIILSPAEPHPFSAQIAFPQTTRPSISESRGQLTLNGKVLLEAEKDGFMSLIEVQYSPAGSDFLVIACGYECNDNVGFVFKSDGSGKRKITSRWDFILQSAIEWSEDGRRIYYYRVNSTGADAPNNAPAEGWVEFNLQTGRKALATTRVLKRTAPYAVFNVRGDDVLNVRSKPGRKAEIVGAIPRDAKGVKVTGAGIRRGRERWVPIRYQKITGWVNQSYLREVRESFDNQQTQST
ncbi:MAG: SH3 domain-containing protein [Blastocatellia bacterium]